MNVKKSIITSLIGLTSFAPCKAQKAIGLAAETGISGVINKEASFYTGMNFEVYSGKNYSDMYAGINISPDKKASFLGLLINDFAWTKNLSSWARETVFVSKKSTDSQLEIAPVRANVNAGKFNFSLSPSYSLNNDLKNKTTTQGFNPILQATYTISPKSMLFFEVKYSSEPAKNLFNTHFGKLGDNTSYMVSYILR